MSDAGPDAWPSLFPESTPKEPQLSQLQHIQDEHEEASPSMSPAISDYQDLSSRSPARQGRAAKVTKRRATGRIELHTLSDVDTEDTVAFKRARNTLAARKSRAKKMQRMDELEQIVHELKQEVSYWKARAMSEK